MTKKVGPNKMIPFCCKPQMDRIKEVEADRKQRQRAETQAMNEAKFNRKGKKGRYP